MARVTYKVDNKVIGSRSMLTPKSVSSLAGWFKEARKALPKNIPDVTNHSREWFISHSVATIDLIIFELHNNINPHTRGLIIIDRNADTLGM